VLGSEDSLIRSAWIFLAALAGGVTALAFMNHRTMTRNEIALTVFVGTTFSLFVVPWLAHRMLGIAEGDTRGIVACCYIGAAGAYTFIPAIVKKARSGKGDSL
jgi:hypothetical membrane protein